MPYNIKVLEEKLIENISFLDFASLVFLILAVSLFVFIFPIIFEKHKDFYDFFIIKKYSKIMILCLIISIILFVLYKINGTSYTKRYVVILENTEQIEYIYNNYDILNINGNIYYIEERNK